MEDITRGMACEDNDLAPWEEPFAYYLKRVTDWQQKILHIVRHYATCIRISRKWNDSEVRIYGLGSSKKNQRTCLLYCDVPVECPTAPAAEWKILVNPTLVKQGKLSREEELLRERQRSFDSGFFMCDYSPINNSFLYSSSGSVMEIEDRPLQASVDCTPLVEGRSSVMGPLYHPKRPQIFAFVSNGEVYVSDREHTVSPAHVNGPGWKYGTPPFITQEEFNRYAGMWWSPRHGEAMHLLVEAFNEMDVAKVTVFCSGSSGEDMETIHYPYAGCKNALWDVKLYTVFYEQETLKVVERSFQRNIHTVFPWAEYLVRIGWTHDGNYVWMLLMDRLQKRECLVAVPVDYFAMFYSVNCPSVEIEHHIVLLYEETSDTWLPAHNSIHILQSSDESCCRFIWLSRQTGYSHLYLVESDMSITVNAAEEAPVPNILKKTQLTFGNWEVSVNAEIVVDEARRLVYFVASADGPLENHVYVMSYAEPQSSMVRLTSVGYSYGSSVTSAFVLNTDVGLLAVFRSSCTSPGECVIYWLAFDGDAESPVMVKAHMALSQPEENGTLTDLRNEDDWLRILLKKPTFFQASRDEFTLSAFLYTPQSVDISGCCPTVVWIYGGPGFQSVHNSWTRQTLLPIFLSQGYAVVVIDGRGSANRGEKFEAASSGKLGQVEIEDQVYMLEKIKETAGVIDMSRLALMGWSYGGFLALMGLAQRPDIFKVSIAGAPVTDWHLYDTAYTERYMGLPHDNVQAYRASCVMSYVDNLPSTPGRLLILHGLRDENVHFKHTSALVRCLVHAGKPYSLQVYPTERHAFRNATSSAHMMATVLNFLQQNLL